MLAENNRVKEWLPSNIPSGFVLQPVPFLRSAALNLPLLGVAASILVLEVVLWPVAGLIRRRYGRRLDLAERERRALWAGRLAAVLGVLFLLGWVILIVAISSGAPFDIGMDPWVRLIQGIGILCIVGLVATFWSASVTLAGSRPWWAKLSSVAVTFALLDLVWFAVAFI